jgi:hypothetical protein
VIYEVPGKLQGDLACPTCRSVLDGCSSIGSGRGPEPGDLTICCDCASLLVFQAHPRGLSFRIATRRDLDAQPPEIRLQFAVMQQGLRMFGALRN